MKDREILEKVLAALGMTAHAFSKKIEYASHTSIYRVLTGETEFTRGMKERIIQHLPNVNYNFLDSGEFPVLLDEKGMQNQANLFNFTIGSMENMLDLKRLAKIPDQLDNIESMLQELLGRKKED
jgi:hypothetical protein